MRNLQEVIDMRPGRICLLAIAGMNQGENDE